MAVTNTPDKSELLPCPFCGNDASVSDGSNGLHFRVICNKSACRAAGPLERCAVDAKDAWNSRAPSRPADQVPDMVEAVAAIICAYKPLGMPQLLPPGSHEAGLKRAAEALAALQAVPASGEVGWQPIESAPKDGTEILILAHGMAIQARYCPGEWSEDTPISPAEYSGALWVAFDDAVQFEIEETPHGDLHGAVTHWRPLPEPPALKSSGEE